jgi:hypothetical protein
MAGTDAASNEAMANGRSLARIRLFILDRPSGSQRKKLLIGGQKSPTSPGACQAHIDAMRDPSCGIAATPRSMEPQNLSSPDLPACGDC